jgi:hypothetical protein
MAYKLATGTNLPGAPTITFVNITHSYFDEDGGPLGGFLTFMPTSDATLTQNVLAEEMSSATSADTPLATQVIPFGATEYVNVNVSLAVLGLGSSSPTGDAVYMAFLQTVGTPQTSDWKTAAWTTQSAPYIASVLVGPDNGGLNLAKGSYYVWLKLVDTPEVTFILAGTLSIT